MSADAPRLDTIVAFRLVTVDDAALARFYVDGLGFSPAGEGPISSAEIGHLELAGGGARLSLALGQTRLDLDSFEAPGRPYPADRDAADLDFQHFAVVTTDIVAAFGQALHHGATPISTAGPVQLPASAGGVTAVKFRDPEGHPLEFLQFPSTAPPGIDHSAISVANADASSRFYQFHGLRPGHRTLNQGPTQAALDGLADPRVDVAPLEGRHSAPHLELLGYRQPRGRPGPGWKPNDIAATRIVWASDRAGLLRDPDGHMHQLVRPEP